MWRILSLGSFTLETSSSLLAVLDGQHTPWLLSLAACLMALVSAAYCVACWIDAIEPPAEAMKAQLQLVKDTNYIR